MKCERCGKSLTFYDAWYLMGPSVTLRYYFCTLPCLSLWAEPVRRGEHA